jgi:phosphoenolpyruvate carboxykinase (GTP)
MEEEPLGYLEKRMGAGEYQKLIKIKNQEVHRFVAKFVEICNPAKVFVCTDSEEDIQFIRDSAIRNHEESKLALPKHTVHFDGYFDQARDKERTKFLLPKGMNLGPEINSIDRDEGLEEIYKILKNIMSGHELYVKFFSLGPRHSEFSMPSLQLTDSCYVSHCENLLYRQGYNEFLRMVDGDSFFKFVHSQGELTEVGLGLQVSKNVEQRRVYIDLQDETIFSTNTQYGGNTIGLKKLAMRLAINRASKENWLTEHMLVMGVHGPGGRVSYFTGAFPSMCGKTSTAMMDGELIVGDDIAYLRNIGGNVRAVNVEIGMFGIIEGINEVDDPLQWRTLHSDNEIIVSNVLVTEDNDVFWNGKFKDIPNKGVNHSGPWEPGKIGPDEKIVTASHKNARFTLSLDILDNVDPALHAREGVEVSGMIYGGRDADTWVPVEEAFDWVHGIITKGAALESQPTAAIILKDGDTEDVRLFNPMSNIDFLSIPIGRYIQNNLDFGARISNPPRIFSVNYFLKNSNGEFTNHKNDKRIWLKWMELRVHDEVEAIKTPTGFIPKYEDLKRLFMEVQNNNYSEPDYIKQFSVRVPKNIEKIDRILDVYKTRVHDTPEILFKVLGEQRDRLEAAENNYGSEITPKMLLDK